MVLRLQTSLVLAFVAVPLVFGESQSVRLVKQFALDPGTVYEIPISQEAPTTLMFPSALTAIEGANVSAHAETPAPVLLSYTPGRNFFSVRATEPNTKAAVNVVWKNQTFVIRFFSGIDALGSVTFYEETQGSRGAAVAKHITPQVLIGVLDRAKSYLLVASQYPQAVRQIEKIQPRTTNLYKNFGVVIEEVFRFDLEDTLVFRLRFESTCDKEIFYQPQRLATRVGEHIYYASIADASGIIPARGVTVAYFAITGTARGGRADLSLKNTFGIIVPIVDRDAKLIFPQ